MKRRILIVDDDANWNRVLQELLATAGHDVLACELPSAALARLREEEFGLVIHDYRMPELTGLEFFEAVREVQPDVPVLVVSGFLEKSDIARFLRDGVTGIFLKPLDVVSFMRRVDGLLRRPPAARREGPAETRPLRAPNRTPASLAEDTLVARHLSRASPAARDFARQLWAVRKFEMTMLLSGEPGTDFAAPIRQLQDWAGHPEGFHPLLDLRELSAPALQAALAPVPVLPGGISLTVGLLADEVPTRAQQERALHLLATSGEFAGLLADSPRLVLGVAGNLEAWFATGEVSETFHVAFSQPEVVLPPLREMPGDLEAFADRLIASHQPAASRGLSSLLAPETEAAFLAHAWPGNHRQVRAAVRQLVELAETKQLTPADLQPLLDRTANLPAPSGEILPLRLHLERTARDLLAALLTLSGGDPVRAAHAAGLTPDRLRSLTARLGPA